MVDRVRLGFAYSILKERPVKGTSSFSELLKAYIQKVDMEQHKGASDI